jgi:hypothetical protein
MHTPEEFEQYRDGIKVLAEQFNQSVEKLVIAETLVNRRRAARYRLGQRYQHAEPLINCSSSSPNRRASARCTYALLFTADDRQKTGIARFRSGIASSIRLSHNNS